MVYGTIDEVRRLAGQRPQKAYGVIIGTGDGTETEFPLNFVGFNEGFILDQSVQTTSNPTVSVGSSDVTVYSNEVPVSVSSIDNEKGTVTLAVAPSNLEEVTADYWHSLVSDDMVYEAMQKAEERVNEIIDGSLDSNAGVDFKYSGDGETTEFWMKAKDVTAINSVTVNSSAQTLGTHYWIEYYDLAKTRIAYIIFKTPPSASEPQNVVVNVDYGQSKFQLVDLSNLLSAKRILLDMPDSAIVGEFKKGNKGTTSTVKSRIRLINEQIAEILDENDRRDILGV